MRSISAALFFLALNASGVFAQQNKLPYVVSEVELNDLRRFESTYLLVQIKAEKEESFLDIYRSRIKRKTGPNSYLISNPDESMNNHLAAAFSVDERWKLSHRFDLQGIREGGLEVVIKTTDFDLTQDRFRLNPKADLLDIYEPARLITAKVDAAYLEEILLWPEVDYVQQNSLAEEETNILSHNLAPNAINWIHHKYPMLTGSGIVLALKERAFNKDDIDLWPRGVVSELEDPQESVHATAMASIAAGAGNTSKLSRGVAYHAQLSSSSFERVLPDNDVYFTNNSYDVQNHSYGLEINNEYDAVAAGYDVQSNANLELLHVFSAGNSGFLTPDNGQYAGLGTYANLTGGFKMAKNILTVGATDELGQVDERSSRGPAYDGRVKPDIVAYGKGGTSEAAALTSGMAVLMKQAYEDLNFQSPESALLKACLIAGAKPVSDQAVSYVSGFGQLNAKRTLELIESGQVFSNDLSSNVEVTHQIIIPPAVKSLRVAVVWNDPAANPGDFKALVHDLDMRVEFGAESWLPWVLDPTPDLGKLSTPPQRKVDTLNNVELITIDNPAPGNYDIHVSAETLTNGVQSYHIAYSIELADSFEWVYPTGSDVLNPNETEVLRFENGFEDWGMLSIKYGDGDWEELGRIDQVDLFQFMVADTSVTAQLRASFGSQEYLSDLFVISPEPVVGKELSCGKDFLMSWLPVENIGEYRVSRINEQGVLEQVMTTTDTAVFLNSEANDWTFDVVSIQPIIGGMSAEQAQVYNFSTDGIGCYFNTFTANVTDETVSLSLDLSTKYNVTGVSFERWNGEEFTALDRQDLGTELTFTFNDSHTHSGYFTYRAAIALGEPMNGEPTSFTESIELAVILPETISVFPNPINIGEDLNLLSDIDQIRWLVLLDSQGNRVKVIEVTSQTDSFIIEGLGSGLYLYQLISEEGEILKTGRLIMN